MTKLTKNQQNQLLGIVVGTLAVMAALWYFVVMAQQNQLAATKRKSADMTRTLKTADDLVRGGEQIGQRLTNQLEVLQKREAGLAPERDPYSWIITTMNPLIQSRKGVNITSFSPPDISDKGLFLHFPYKWAVFHVKGVGYYQEFGRFFADFENTFPAFRIQNIEISAGGLGLEPEKLEFHFDIVTPLVPGGQETK